MKNPQFIHFLNTFKDVNPTLIEAIKTGFRSILEDSTETQVEDIKNTLTTEKITSDISEGKYYKPKVEEPVLDDSIPSLEDLGVEEDTSEVKEPLEETQPAI